MATTVIPDSFEERCHCAIHAALEAAAEDGPESVTLAESVHALEALIPQVVPDSS